LSDVSDIHDQLRSHQLRFVRKWHGRDGFSQTTLHYCFHFREWLRSQCEKHHIDVETLTTAELIIEMEIETQRKEGGNPGSLTTAMKIDCSSLIVMDAQEYRSAMRDEQTNGLGQIIRGHTY
jgi:hypothetical protein